jgi:HAD superfamily hydrolase (TIGR01509 family)
MLKAVLFDLDQTLLDWSQVQPWEDFQRRRVMALFDYARGELGAPAELTLEALVAAFGQAISAAWQHARLTLQAPDIRLVLGEALAAVGVPTQRADPAALLSAFNGHPPRGERAYDDVLAVLPQIQAQGVALGLITNSANPMTMRDHELRAAGMLHLFPACRLSAVDVGVIKPHPAIFRRGLALLNVEPGEAVFVGDSLQADVAGAQGVGLYGVWLARQGEASESDDTIVPDATITTLHELLPVLDSRFAGWRNGRER